MARDRETDRIVGLKIADLKNGSLSNASRPWKKPPEGLIASKVVHPNVVKTYEYGTSSTKQNYLVMEHSVRAYMP